MNAAVDRDRGSGARPPARSPRSGSGRRSRSRRSSAERCRFVPRAASALALDAAGTGPRPRRAEVGVDGRRDRHQILDSAIELGEALAAPLRQAADPDTSYRTALRGTPDAASATGRTESSCGRRAPDTRAGRGPSGQSRARPVVGPGDELGDQRVVEHRHRVSRAHPAIVSDARARGRTQARESGRATA